MPTTTVKTIGSGGGRDYTTLQSWEDASPANLVTADEIWRGEIYNDSEFVSASAILTIAGSTTDSTRYKELTTASGQSAWDNSANPIRFDATKGVALRCTGGYLDFVTINEANARFSKIQIRGVNGNVNPLKVQAAGLIERLLVQGSGVLIEFNGTARNCAFIQINGNNAAIGGSCGVYSCTFVKDGSAVTNMWGWNYWTGTMKNVYAGNCTNVSSNDRGTVSNCYTSSANTRTGFTLNTAYSTANFANVTLATLDLKLVSGSALLDVGATLTSESPEDIFGTSRPQGSAYDIGAHELAAAAATSMLARRRSFNNLFQV